MACEKAPTPMLPAGSKRMLNAVTTALLAVLLYMAAVQLPAKFKQDAPAAAPPTPSGSLVARVLDVRNLSPIEGAVVVVPETGERYVTGTDGRTPVITVPLIKDVRFDKVSPKPWGEISLIAYKQGYLPYAVFYLQIHENQRRNGPNLYLIRPEDTAAKGAISIIEGPAQDWVQAIVEKYAPK